MSTKHGETGVTTERGTVVSWDNIIWCPEWKRDLPVVHDAPGRLRVRVREGEFVRAYLKTERGIREFSVADCGDHYELVATGEENLTVR